MMKTMMGRGFWIVTSWRSPELSIMPESESMESWEQTAGGAGGAGRGGQEVEQQARKWSSILMTEAE